MVVQVLANLSPAMIPDYAQAHAVYVETDESSLSAHDKMFLRRITDKKGK